MQRIFNGFRSMEIARMCSLIVEEKLGECSLVASNDYIYLMKSSLDRYEYNTLNPSIFLF